MLKSEEGLQKILKTLTHSIYVEQTLQSVLDHIAWPYWLNSMITRWDWLRSVNWCNHRYKRAIFSSFIVTDCQNRTGPLLPSITNSWWCRPYVHLNARMYLVICCADTNQTVIYKSSNFGLVLKLYGIYDAMPPRCIEYRGICCCIEYQWHPATQRWGPGLLARQNQIRAEAIHLEVWVYELVEV